MALSCPTLALIFLAIVVAAPGGATLAEANGEPSKKHDANANANATAPANPAPEGHPVEASANPVANGDHVVAPAGPVAKGHHPPGKGHHKKGGHRKRHPVDAPAGAAPPSPVTEAPPASDPAPKADHANAPEIPATAPQPAYAPARAPSTATPPTGGRVQVPPELKKLLPSLPPSAEPKELKELISKATGMDPSSIPDINDPHQIEEIIGKIGMNGLPPNTDSKQLNDVIGQYSGMKPSDVESFFSKAAGGLSPNGNAGSAEASPSKEEPSGAFTIGATSMATALVAAVAAGCFIF